MPRGKNRLKSLRIRSHFRNPEQGGVFLIRNVFLLLSFFLTGAFALVYEIFWIRRLEVFFGVSLYAQASVFAVWMAGMAFGAWAVSVFSKKIFSPLKAYGFLECVVAGWFFLQERFWETWNTRLSAFFFDKVQADFSLFFSVFAAAVLILGIPTAAMGATFPLVCRGAESTDGRSASWVAWLYGGNILGAVAGVLFGGLWGMPRFAFSSFLKACAFCNVLVGAAWLVLGKKTVSPGQDDCEPPEKLLLADCWKILALAFGAGAAAMVLEVAFARLLGNLLGSTIWAVTWMLAAFLAGMGLGSAAVGWDLRRFSAEKIAQGAFAAAGFLTSGVVLAWPWFPELLVKAHHGFLAGGVDPENVYVLASGTLAFLALLPVTFFSGMLFPVLSAMQGQSEEVGQSVGKLYFVHTLGAVAGSLLAGFWLVPHLGVQWSLGSAVLFYFAAALWMDPPVARRWPWKSFFVFAAATWFWVFAVKTWDPRRVSGWYHWMDWSGRNVSFSEAWHNREKNYHLLYHKEGKVATVAVEENRSGERFLSTNGKTEATTRIDLQTQVLVGSLPVMAWRCSDGLEKPRDGGEVLVIGMGSGTSAGSALKHPIRSLHIVELEPAVVEASRYFDHMNGRPLDDSRVKIFQNDGRFFLTAAPWKYDVIVSEPSNPWVHGAANLFTREFFMTVFEKLKPEGVFGQWIQLINLTREETQVFFRTLQSVFPYVYAFQGPQMWDLCVLGLKKPLNKEHPCWKMFWLEPAVREDLKRVQVFDFGDLERMKALEPRLLEKWLPPDGPMNRDELPTLEWSLSRRLLTFSLEGFEEIQKIRRERP